MLTRILNPFTYISGLQSLVIGLVLTVLTILAAYYANLQFSLLSYHTRDHAVPAWYYITDQLINTGILVLVFFLAGRLFSGAVVRFSDVAGKVVLATGPALLIAIVTLPLKLLKYIHEWNFNIVITKGGMGILFLVLFITIGCMAWMIILLYNAFCVSCKLSGKKSVVLFIAALILSEAISKAIFYYLPLI